MTDKHAEIESHLDKMDRTLEESVGSAEFDLKQTVAALRAALAVADEAGVEKIHDALFHAQPKPPLPEVPLHTVRRAPAPSFAHAICIDQFDSPRRWMVIDAYGYEELITDKDVADWPVVYTPSDD